MKRIHGLQIGLLLTTAVWPARAEPTKAFAQPPCVTTSLCARFDVQTTFPLTLRTFAVSIPGPGRILWSFDGSAQCLNTNTSGPFGFGVANFTAAIVADPKVSPTLAEPSANQFFLRLPPFNQVAFPQAVNLHTSRLISYARSGQKTVYLNVQSNRLDALVTCNVFTGAFTAVFMPND